MVKAIDSKSIGLCPHRFESCSLRVGLLFFVHYFFCSFPRCPCTFFFFCLPHTHFTAHVFPFSCRSFFSFLFGSTCYSFLFFYFVFFACFPPLDILSPIFLGNFSDFGSFLVFLFEFIACESVKAPVQPC